MTLYHSLDITLPETVVVGKGTYLPISGWAFDSDQDILGISVCVGEQSYQLTHTKDFRADVFSVYKQAFGFKALDCGFFGSIPFQQDAIGQTFDASLQIHYADRTDTIEQGSLNCVRAHDTKVIEPSDAGLDSASPAIAICMATYCPDIKNFKVQLQSIQAQTHKNWVLIINDDCSSDKHLQEIKALTDDDARIFVFQNKSNLGFYRNFERALEYVGSGFDHVAFADQDDFWYPEKLERCLEAMTPESSLVYSDMRIVNDDGDILSETFWSSRENYYDDISMLLLANTVTGAASLFRRSLLDTLLPFPTQLGDIFHDQWLSVVARALGPINYIDTPLYNYIQHGSNVIGHADFQAPSPFKRLARAGKNSLGFARQLPSSAKPVLKESVSRAWAIYQYEFRRLGLMADNLKLRTAGNPSVDLSALDMFEDRWTSIRGLLMKHIQLINSNTTNHAEWRMLQSRILVTLSKRAAILATQWNSRGDTAALPQATTPSQLAASAAKPAQPEGTFQTAIDFKTRPLTLDIRDDEPQRVNLLVPEINFKHLFGGYIGKFNFALRLVQTGLKVRLVIVDPCDFQPLKVQQGLAKYPGLEDILDRVEVSSQSDRDHPLVVSPQDSFIATTWWTAYIAHAACQDLNRSEFLYFIQEYEPFTFAMGAYFAIAHNSYALPHSALFSTPLLMEYFQQQGYGVFDPSVTHAPLKQAFENAIQTFELPKEKPERSVKKLLFYSRPEPHAARNMFELGVVALNQAISNGAFDGEEWEFYGIGSEKYPFIPLANGHRMKMIGKVSLDEYRTLLPQYDIGLALMYTPHPSLLPLEMAAAGMLVVTNTCLNKTTEKLRDISSNIFAAAPTPESIADNLSVAAFASSDWEMRRAGSNVKWSSDWHTTFNKDLMTKLADRFAAIAKPSAAAPLSSLFGDNFKLFRNQSEFINHLSDNPGHRLLVKETAEQIDCPICHKRTPSFHYPGIEFVQDGIAYTNLREGFVCQCQMNNRQRLICSAVDELVQKSSFSAPCLFERLTSLYYRLLERLPNLEGSEFLGIDKAAGRAYALHVEGQGEIMVEHQDVSSLSYDDHTKDLLLSCDVLEHVPDYRASLKEAYRVLKPGGILLFSAPFSDSRPKTFRRAQLHADGQVEHFMEPEVHGNPIDPEGSLVFHSFGWDLLDAMREVGFEDAAALYRWQPSMGFVHTNSPDPDHLMGPFVFAAVKSPTKEEN